MAQTGSTLNIRNEADQSAPLGIATTRYEDRVAATLLGAGHAKAAFKEHEALCGVCNHSAKEKKSPKNLYCYFSLYLGLNNPSFVRSPGHLVFRQGNKINSIKPFF